MKHYTIRKLIKGYKLKTTLRGLTLIGIPHHSKHYDIMVNHKGIKMLITKNSPMLHKEMFKDKFRPTRMYVLYYYEWQPNTLQKTLF